MMCMRVFMRVRKTLSHSLSLSLSLSLCMSVCMHLRSVAPLSEEGHGEALHPHAGEAHASETGLRDGGLNLHTHQ